ncbi:unnamed protein product [Arctogadus glacialis]
MSGEMARGGARPSRAKEVSRDVTVKGMFCETGVSDPQVGLIHRCVRSPGVSDPQVCPIPKCVRSPGGSDPQVCLIPRWVRSPGVSDPQVGPIPWRDATVCTDSSEEGGVGERCPLLPRPLSWSFLPLVFLILRLLFIAPVGAALRDARHRQDSPEAVGNRTECPVCIHSAAKHNSAFSGRKLLSV